MYSNDDLNAAVQAGILRDEEVKAFRNHIAQLRNAPLVDEEQFRLITGFNDIFVVIACLLLLVSISWIGMESALWIGALLHTVTAWALAEYFTRKRRMALPSIVLLLAFVGGVLATGSLLLFDSVSITRVNLGIPSAFAALAAWLHWLRFKVPITVAAGAAALVVSIIMLLLSSAPQALGWLPGLTFGAGVLVFLLAMCWDAADTQRLTRKSDVAFWLHLLAAPLLVHPVFSTLAVFEAQTDVWQAAAVVTLYALIALLSLSIDRRALMVTALAYVLYAFDALLEQAGVISLGFALTAFVIGSGLLLLSAFWHACRKILIGCYPAAFHQYLPPLRQTD